MTEYKYTGNGQFYQNLPMIDLDDKDLTDEQISLLMIAQKRGLYAVMETIKLEKPVRNGLNVKSDPQDSTTSINKTEESNEPPKA